MQLAINGLTKLKGHAAAVYQLLRAGDKLISAAGDGNVVVWDCSKGWPSDGLVVAKSAHPIFAMCSAVTRSYLFFGDFSGDFYRLDLQSFDIRRIQWLGSPIYAMTIDENRIWIGDKFGRVSIWDTEQLDVRHQIRLSHKSIRSIEITNAKAIIGDSEGYLHILSTEDFSILYQMPEAHLPAVFSIANAATYIYSGGRDAQLRQWTSDLQPLNTVAAHMSTINKIAIHPNGNLLATASRDKSIRIWTIPELTLLKVIDQKFNAHWHSVNHLLWWDATHLISASDDRSIGIWQVEVIS